MRVHGRKKIEDFGQKYSDARSQLEALLAEMEDACWLTPIDIRERYATASIVGDRRVVFNIKGNKYRIDTKISYKHQTIIIKRIGTHAEYDRWEF